RLLGRGFQRFDIIGEHQGRICAPSRAQQVAAAASPCPPQIDDALAERAGGELAHARQRFGIRAGDEIVEFRRRALRNRERQLLHQVRRLSAWTIENSQGRQAVSRATPTRLPLGTEESTSAISLKSITTRSRRRFSTAADSADMTRDSKRRNSSGALNRASRNSLITRGP